MEISNIQCNLTPTKITAHRFFYENIKITDNQKYIFYIYIKFDLFELEPHEMICIFEQF